MLYEGGCGTIRPAPGGMSRADLLKVCQLSVRYKIAGSAEHAALENISFEIAENEVVGVLGESGCGKSTLCLALLGLLPPTARLCGGSILLGDRDVTRLTEAALQKIRGAEISIVFQEPALSLNPVMRTGEQIAAVLRAHTGLDRRQQRKRVEELLDDVQLSPAERIYRSYPHELSGGQQQRIAIAQALACRPKLVIADEPTASLDLTTQAEILQLMRAIREKHGTSFLIVSHSPGVLGMLADRIIVLRAGKILEQGSAKELLTAPQEQYTAGLIHPFRSRAMGAAP